MLTAEGRLAARRGRAAMFNPRYELAPPGLPVPRPLTPGRAARRR